MGIFRNIDIILYFLAIGNSFLGGKNGNIREYYNLFCTTVFETHKFTLYILNKMLKFT